MEIEKAIQGLKESGIWDIDNAEYTRAAKIKSLIFAKYNLEYDLKEVSDYLKLKINLIEISNNFFILKSLLEEILKEKSRSDYKSILEGLYIIQVDEEKLLNINIELKKYTFEELLRYGLDNSYVKEKWLQKLEIEESEYTDIYEVIQELNNRGIEIK